MEENLAEINIEVNSELVSIIMPAYNAEDFIAESIESVLHQTYKNFELLIVDDGSTDSTKNIVGAYQAKDARVIYVYQLNSGVSVARNHALALAKGKYLSNLDSDDLWPKDKLEIQIALLANNDQKIILGNVERFSAGANGEKKLGLVTCLNPACDSKMDYVLKTLNLPSNKMVHFNTFCGRAEFFRAAGGWDEELRSAEDWDFWLRLGAQVEFLHLNHIFQLYRKHSTSATLSATSYTVSLNAQLNVIEKCVSTVNLGWGAKRRAKVRAYTEAIKHQLYIKNTAAAVTIYLQAMVHSNILFGIDGLKLLMTIIKNVLGVGMDKLK